MVCICLHVYMCFVWYVYVHECMICMYSVGVGAQYGIYVCAMGYVCICVCICMHVPVLCVLCVCVCVLCMHVV